MMNVAMHKLIPLTSVPVGRKVRVMLVEGGRAVRGRLCAMGLTPGTSAEIVANSGGPLVLAVLGCRVMIGRGMACRVMVREV